MKVPVSRLLILVVVIMVTVDGETLPKLPDDPFQVTVQANIFVRNLTAGTTRNYSAYYEEYSDYVNGRSFLMSISKSIERRYYYKKNIGFKVTRDIQTTPLAQASCEVYDGLMNGKLERFGPVNSTRFFQWSKERSPSYKGKDMVKGIPATKYVIRNDSRVGNIISEMNITYWFSDNHPMPYYGNKSVPLRIKLDGFSNRHGNHTFTHIYDFTLVAPLGPKDDSFFAVPKGVFCAGIIKPRGGSEIRTPDAYRVHEEYIDEKSRTSTQLRTYVDYHLKLTRQDHYFKDNALYKNSSVRVIHDFANQLEIVMIDTNKTCQVKAMSGDTPAALSWDSRPDDSGKFKLLHTEALDIFQHLHYQGERRERGVLVEVWSNMTSFPNGTVKVTEVSTARSDWKVVATDTSRPTFNVWTGFYIYIYDNNTHDVLNEVQVNVFDQYFGALDQSVFAIDEVCYPQDALEKTHLNFLISDLNNAFTNGEVTLQALVLAVRRLVVDLTKLSSTRVTDVEIYQAGDKILRAWFVLRSQLSVEGKQDHTKQLDNVKAVTELEISLSKPDTHFLSVTRVDGTSEKMFVASLVKGGDGKDISKEVQSADDATKSGYNAGDMAGLGIGMLILGALLALGFMGVVWIKRFDINLPYARQSA